MALTGAVRKVLHDVRAQRKELQRKVKRIDKREKFDSFDHNVILRTVHRLQKEKRFVS